LVALEQPDVAIVDIRMPPTHTDEGLLAARRIRERYPAAVVVLSQYLEAQGPAKCQAPLRLPVWVLLSLSAGRAVESMKGTAGTGSSTQIEAMLALRGNDIEPSSAALCRRPDFVLRPDHRRSRVTRDTLRRSGLSPCHSC
jgi:CheY-like chemotaxis protein